MDDERWEPGMPVLDRQAVPEGGPGPRSGGSPSGGSPSGARRPAGRPLPSALPPSLAGLPPRSVPEVAPTPLQAQYVYLSVIVFFAGTIAISALELGAGFGHPLVKLGVLIGAPILCVTTADASLRIWRSAWAWMPVDARRGLFRLSWLVVSGLLLVLTVGAFVAVLTA